MLHQISWYTYAVSIISLVIIYYLYVGLTFYRTEVQSVICKLSGKQPALKAAGNGDLQIPDDDIMGKAAPGAVGFVSQEELSFGPDEEDPAASATENDIPAETNSHLTGHFSDMMAEVKTLIRVINESGESRENFEMLFRLVIQKYAALKGTPFQQQINAYLMTEAVPQFPFSFTAADINNYWTDKN